MLAVGAQSGYWGNWRGAGRLRMLFYWKVLFPALTHALGYLPLRSLTGGGDDVPPGVALEWASWGRDPDYVLSYARRKDGARAYARFTDFFQRRFRDTLWSDARSWLLSQASSQAAA